MAQVEKISTKTLAVIADAQFFHLFEGGATDPRLNERYMRNLMEIAGRAGDVAEKRRLGGMLRGLRSKGKQRGLQAGTFEDPAMADWLGIGLATGEVDAKFIDALPRRQTGMRSLVEEHPEYFGFEGPFNGKK